MGVGWFGAGSIRGDEFCGDEWVLGGPKRQDSGVRLLGQWQGLMVCCELKESQEIKRWVERSGRCVKTRVVSKCVAGFEDDH